jgi:hypothetical protein
VSESILTPPSFADALAPESEPAPCGDAPPPPRARARTLSVARLSKRELARWRAEFPADINEGDPRPRTVAECDARGLGEPGSPCPYVSCKYHLYLDVSPSTGSIQFNFPDREPDELEHTCALRVAESGGVTLEGVGATINVTRERVRQIETRSLARMAAHAAVRDLAPGAPGGSR